MLKLDNNLLQELGLGSLPEDQKKAMLQHIYDTLELRVGTQLANQMTDQQLEEFEQFIDSGGDASQAQALQWLETNLPNYKQVVNDVFESLKGEIKQMAPQIAAAAAAQPAVPAQAAPQDPAAYQQPAAPQPQYQQPAPAQNDYQQSAQQYAQPQYQAPAPQQPAQQPHQQAAPAPAPQQPSYPPAQDQSFAQPAAPQPQYQQPQQPPTPPQFPNQQPPAGPGQ